jgi:signal transduction histidine kinase
MGSRRAPRLVPRFALSSLVAFIAIGVALSVVISGQLRDRAEKAAQFHAEFVSSSILRYQLTEQDLDFLTPMHGARYQELRSFVAARIVNFPVVRIKVWRSDGTVIFSDDERLVGHVFSVDEGLVSAFRNHVFSEISDLDEPENIYERSLGSKLFATYVPMYLDVRQTSGPPVAVAEIYQDYKGVQSELDRLFKTLVLTLLIGLGALYVLLLPIVVQVNRRLARHLQEEQKTVAELRELNRLKGNFVAIASHELRTPLTSIIGFVKTLRRPEFRGDAEMQQEFLGSVERQADRLLKMVENLLTTSQLEASPLRLNLEPVSFSRLAGDLLEALGPRARRVRLDVPDELPQIVTDRYQLGLIVSNLLDNALKYSPNGEPCELAARTVGEEFIITVTDRGIGIAPGQVDRIFDRFYQVDSSSTRSYGGVGLGLNLVKEIVTGLGGTITVDSQAARGSTFSIALPIHPESWAPAERGDPSETAGDDGHQALKTKLPSKV